MPPNPPPKALEVDPFDFPALVKQDKKEGKVLEKVKDSSDWNKSTNIFLAADTLSTKVKEKLLAEEFPSLGDSKQPETEKKAVKAVVDNKIDEDELED